MTQTMTAAAGRSGVKTRLRALRAFAFPASVLPVFVATAAAAPMGQWRWDLLLLTAMGVACLHGTGNLLNDYYDYHSGVDRKVEGDENRPGRCLVRGQLRPRDVLTLAAACLALAAPICAYIVWQRGPGVFWFAAPAVVSLYCYTGPPLRLKYHALGELVIFITYGPLLLLGAAYVQTGRLEWPVFWASLPIGLATTAILIGNNLRDEDEDGQAGIRTLTQVLGRRPVRVLYVACVLASALGLAVIGLVTPARLLMAAPLVLAAAARPLGAVISGRRLPDIDAQTARYVALLSVFAFVGYVVASYGIRGKLT